MLSELRSRLKPLKRCSKLLSKRFAIRLTLAQSILCKASGFRDIGDISVSRAVPGDDCVGATGGVQQEVWAQRLRGELGADFDELFPFGDQDLWWRRIHGRHDGEEHDHFGEP